MYMGSRAICGVCARKLLSFQPRNPEAPHKNKVQFPHPSQVYRHPEHESQPSRSSGSGTLELEASNTMALDPSRSTCYNYIWSIYSTLVRPYSKRTGRSLPSSARAGRRSYRWSRIWDDKKWHGMMSHNKTWCDAIWCDKTWHDKMIW